MGSTAAKMATRRGRRCERRPRERAAAHERCHLVVPQELVRLGRLGIGPLLPRHEREAARGGRGRRRRRRQRRRRRRRRRWRRRRRRVVGGAGDAARFAARARRRPPVHSRASAGRRRASVGLAGGGDARRPRAAPLASPMARLQELRLRCSELCSSATPHSPPSPPSARLWRTAAADLPRIRTAAGPAAARAYRGWAYAKLHLLRAEADHTRAQRAALAGAPRGGGRSACGGRDGWPPPPPPRPPPSSPTPKLRGGASRVAGARRLCDGALRRCALAPAAAESGAKDERRRRLVEAVAAGGPPRYASGEAGTPFRFEYWPAERGRSAALVSFRAALFAAGFAEAKKVSGSRASRPPHRR